MRCILHIGNEKTGTTTLQKVLYKNKSVFSRHGIYLTENFGKPNNRLFAAYFERARRTDFWRKKNLSSKDGFDKYFKDFKKNFRLEISK